MTTGTHHPIRFATSADYPAKKLAALPTHIALSEDFSDSVDLIHLGIGKTLPQGGLFAYLFRRFGYPNHGWDDYKELACYLLTTTHPGMLMRVVPYAEGDTSISISFHVDRAAMTAVREWETRSRDQWRRDLLDWIEAEIDIPDWMEDVVAAAQEGHIPVRVNRSEVPLLSWRHVFDSLAFFSYPSKETPDPRAEWRDAMIATYNQIIHEPDLDYRSSDWTEWDDADPLKPYARAILQTLRELQRPVWVRDCPITPEGNISDTDAYEIEKSFNNIPAPQDEILRARSAGFPSGDLGNIDPHLFGTIHAEIIKLGNGDSLLGMQRALEKLKSPEGSVSL